MLHQIGSGVLGPVFRGFDPQRDRIVAVKAFKLDLLPEDVARLAAALRRLVAAGFRDPHHVELIDAGLEGTTPFLVSEYVPGETLDVARRQLSNSPATAVLPWLRQLAEAIDHANNAGLRHGSLHPRDVLVASRTGDFLVTGAGIAGALESVGARVPVRRPYTAPERTSGDPWDARADVYSLAAIAHELLTGRRPAGPGEQDGALAGGLTPEQRVAVRKVLATGLAERPEARFESASSFVQAVDVAVSGGQPVLPVVVPQPPAVEAAPIEVEPAEEPPPLIESTAISEPPVSSELAVISEPAVISELAVTREPAISEPTVIIESATVAESAPATPVAPAPKEPPAPPILPARIVAPAIAAAIPPPPEIMHRDVMSIRDSHQPVPFVPPPEPSSYPWAAIAAVGLAGLVLGGVLGYRGGIRQGAPPSAPPVGSAPAPAPADTEVAVVPQEPAPSPPDRANAPAIEPQAHRAAAVTGRLTVQSDPTGALVTVDGRYRGETPVTIRDLPLGAYTVQIARPGHIPWSDRVTLTSSTPARVVAADLQPGLDMSGRVTGSVYIDSRPRGARVMIDGRFVGTTPFRMPGLAAGRHDVRLELDGFRAATRLADVTAGRELRMAITLDPGTALPGGRDPR